MSTSENKNICSEFTKRLIELFQEGLGRNYVSVWAKRISVSPQTIRDSWFKGGFPGADKIIRICKEADISANWLLLGIGPQRLSESSEADLGDADMKVLIEEIVENNRYLRKRVQELESKLKRFEEQGHPSEMDDESLIEGGSR